VNHHFNHETKVAGKDWTQGFLIRNRELRVRKPEPTAVLRILALNKIEATRIYKTLVTVFEMYKFGLNHIFSVDESGFSFVQKPASAIQLSKTGFDCHKY
jgi:hypothetical protein